MAVLNKKTCLFGQPKCALGKSRLDQFSTTKYI